MNRSPSAIDGVLRGRVPMALLQEVVRLVDPYRARLPELPLHLRGSITK